MSLFRTTVAAAALLWALPAAAQEREVRIYNIHHGLFGDIGTLSDEITREGDTTRVVTSAEVKVEVLGLTLHHVRVSWCETWQAGKLEDYRATTMRNGETELVAGWHEDGRFLIKVRSKEFEAPADIHPVHPWSLQFVRASRLMSPESGRVFAAAIVDKGEEWIGLNGSRSRARHYVAKLDTQNHLYFDEGGTLLLAEYRDITGRVRFTLQAADERATSAS